MLNHCTDLKSSHGCKISTIHNSWPIRFMQKMSTHWSKALSETNLCLTFQNILRHNQIIQVDDAMNGNFLHKMDFISHIQGGITQCKTQPGMVWNGKQFLTNIFCYVLKSVFVAIRLFFLEIIPFSKVFLAFVYL